MNSTEIEQVLENVFADTTVDVNTILADRYATEFLTAGQKVTAIRYLINRYGWSTARTVAAVRTAAATFVD